MMLAVQLAARGGRSPGALGMGAHDDADVPFTPGEDFPFEDCAVAALDADAFLEPLAYAMRCHVLLECRRVLRPGGALRIAVTQPESVPQLVHLAALIGLEAAAHQPADHALTFTKPSREVTGDPLVSIAIPAYNPPFFAQCLDSAIAQTYDNIDIVVCDDSRGPEIEDIVRSRVGRRSVRYERNAERLRTRGNFVRCFERANGEFVKFLCDDDLLAPQCVERLLDAFRQSPDITLATSHRRRIDATGAELGDQPATVPIVAASSVIAGHTLANAMLMAGLNTIGEPSTALFRKADFLDKGPRYFHFRGAPGHGVIDMVMWSALLMKGNAVYLRESLSCFRVHPSQRQHDPVTRQRSIASIRGLQDAWLELGIHERHAPHLLLTRPFPPGDADWDEVPVLGMSARRVSRKEPSASSASPASADHVIEGPGPRPPAARPESA